MSVRGVAQSGLERAVRDREAGGSNPLAPTKKMALRICEVPFFINNFRQLECIEDIQHSHIRLASPRTLIICIHIIIFKTYDE